MSESDLGEQLQHLFKDLYIAVDLKYLRPIKRRMFTCGQECLDDRNSPDQVEKCSDDCGKVFHRAMNIVQTEVNSFQGRIDRCLMDCQDDVRSEKDEHKAKRQFEKCAESCITKFAPLVPNVAQSLCDKLQKLKDEQGIK